MLFDESSERSGYAEELFVVKPGKSAFCGICFGILKDCHQCSNFHNFCKYCLSQSLLRLSKCPQCKIDLTVATMQRNRPLNDVIGEFKVQCYSKLQLNIAVSSNQQAKKKTKLLSCSWSGELNELAAHMVVCQYAKTVCPFGCGSEFPKYIAESHEISCEFRPEDCMYCFELFPRNQLETHRSSCCMKPVDSLNLMRQAREPLAEELLICTKTIAISGAYGVNAAAINGIYDPSNEFFNERTHYIKRGPYSSITIDYYPPTKEWILSDHRCGYGIGYAIFGCDPPVVMEESNIETSRVVNNGRWEKQSSLAISVVLEQSRRSRRLNIGM